MIHDYLGMNLDCETKGIVKMLMIKYLKKSFEDFPEEIGRASSMLALDHLFQVRDPDDTEKLGKYLSKEHAEQFHHRVAQFLFISG